MAKEDPPWSSQQVFHPIPSASDPVPGQLTAGAVLGLGTSPGGRGGGGAAAAVAAPVLEADEESDDSSSTSPSNQDGRKKKRLCKMQGCGKLDKGRGYCKAVSLSVCLSHASTL